MPAILSKSSEHLVDTYVDYPMNDLGSVYPMPDPRTVTPSGVPYCDHYQNDHHHPHQVIGYGYRKLHYDRCYYIPTGIRRSANPTKAHAFDSSSLMNPNPKKLPNQKYLNSPYY